jgi:hypothetical protein
VAIDGRYAAERSFAVAYSAADLGHVSAISYKRHQEPSCLRSAATLPTDQRDQAMSISVDAGERSHLYDINMGSLTDLLRRTEKTAHGWGYIGPADEQSTG